MKSSLSFSHMPPHGGSTCTGDVGFGLSVPWRVGERMGAQVFIQATSSEAMKMECTIVMGEVRVS